MDNLIIKPETPIRKVLEILDGSYTKTLFVAEDSGRLLGSLTDGDIRRWVLKTNDIKGTAGEVCNRSPFVLTHPIDREQALGRMKQMHLEAAPLVDQQGHILSVVLRRAMEDPQTVSEQLLADIPVVIMAGGKGERLDPFTRILPKPLIPIGNQAVIERIMNHFAQFGANNFYLTLNHKAGLIKAYFEDLGFPGNVHFVEEESPLGTAGSLALIKDQLKGSFFVSNCDVILRSDCNEMLRFHRERGFALTMVTALHHHAIPYGVCQAGEEGNLISLTEKPEYSLLVNTGIYILESHVLDLIPEGRMYHITDLISEMQQSGMPVGVFPVPAGAYHDIGQWREYRSTLSHYTDGEVYPSA